MQCTVTHIGISSVHSPGFVWSRPEGLGRWMFMHMPVATRIRDRHGTDLCVPGSCILLDPSFPHWHRADDSPIRNDWFWAIGSGLDERLAHYRLPCNELLRPANTTWIPDLLADMVHEQLRREPFWQERIGQLVDGLLLQLARQTAPAPDLGRDGHDRLGRVREEIHTRLDEAWTVPAMARLVGLGPDRFTVRYRERFGIAPLEDLLRARLRRACLLLALEGRSVSEAAQASGFQDLPYFSRFFRQRIGCSPRRFRAGNHPLPDWL